MTATTTTNSTGSFSSASISVSPLFVVVGGISIVLGVALLVFLRMGFRSLSNVAETFSTPSNLALLALIGYAVVVAGLLLLVGGLVQASGCTAPAGSSNVSCLLNGAVVGGVILLILGVILALIGLIGVLIGIWRLGTRYNESMFKVAAILLIFPYVSIIGYILILIGSDRALARV